MGHASQGERRIRGTAIYPRAALLNHECLPNVARFDDFDSPHLRAPHNTAVRPLHPAAASSDMGSTTSMHAGSTALARVMLFDNGAAAVTVHLLEKGRNSSECMLLRVQHSCDGVQVHFRAMHDLPAGEEFTQSYFPLNASYAARQQRCAEQYGFTCTCPRCKVRACMHACMHAHRSVPCAHHWAFDLLHGSGKQAACCRYSAPSHGMSNDCCPLGVTGQEEATWPEDADADDWEPAVAMEQDEEDTSRADAGYIQVFLLKYVCPQADCFGTMAPVGVGSSLHECSMCRHQRSEAEFMADLEVAMQQG